MSKQLFPHQEYAVQWMIEREKDTQASGGFLCDEMGLGKTISSIGLLLKSRVSYTLILGPLAVLDQWSKAVKESGPAVFLLKKGRWECQGGNIMKGRVYITNYDKLASQPSAFDLSWNRILCDEAHTVRNANGKRYKELKKLKTDRMWLLTGTPIVNSKKDLSALVALFNHSIEPNHSPSLEEAKLWMSQYALCRTSDQLRKTLDGVFPPKPTVIEHVIPFETEKEATFYRAVQKQTSKQLEMLQDSGETDALLMLQILMRLRQVSVHPQIYINAKRKRFPKYKVEDWIGDSTKTNAIVSILNNDKESHGYVIFCHFQEEIQLLKERLQKETCVGSVQVYSGGMTNAQRASVLAETENATMRINQVASDLHAAFPKSPSLPSSINSIISSFLPPKHTILLAQIQSAGTGLNLQYMNRVIFTTSWWTAALMDQAIGRVLRMGQKKDVLIHHILLEEEYDEEMDEMDEQEEKPRSIINIDAYINERVNYKRSLCIQLLDAANHTLEINQ